MAQETCRNKVGINDKKDLVLLAFGEITEDGTCTEQYTIKESTI
jgi:hypothetical protein